MRFGRFSIISCIFAALFLLPGISAAGALPDSGQTKCYNDTAEITCPAPGEDFYGQDAQYVTNPRSYTKLDAGGNDLPDSATSWTMVRDNVTGLIWEVKTDDGSVHDKDNTYTWDDAQNMFIAELNTTSFGGYSDWRMPTIKELASVANLGRYNPAIDTEYLPNAQLSNYWSANSYAYNTVAYAWCMLFSNGHGSHNSKSNSHYVRGVRSGQSGVFDPLVINGDNTVTDTDTGLMWQQQGPDSSMNWKEALAYCESLDLAGYSDWHLPTREELRSIADYGKYSPTIDTEYFPDTHSSFYLSATIDNTDNAWYVSFNDGSDVYGYDKSKFHYYVRAVRLDGQFAPLIISADPAAGGTVTGTGISCPGDCHETYDSGTEVQLTANPNPDYRFVRWEGDISSTNISVTITMNTARNVTAIFEEEDKWEITTVDSDGMAGRHVSVALDPNNHPGISYSTQSSPYLIKFAKRDNVDNWTTEVVRINNNPGYGATELAFDSNSFPRIVSDDSPSNHSYSECNGSSWQTQTFSVLPARADISIDDSDFSHIVWYANANLEYRLWNGSVWQTHTLDASGDVGYDAQLISDAQGRKYISYGEWGHKLKFAFHDGSSWSVEYVDNLISSANSPHPIALTSQNNPVILYLDNEDGVLVPKLASKTDGIWQFETVPLTTHIYPGRKFGFAIDESDRIHISCYQKESVDSDICYLKYFLHDGVNWSSQIVDQFTDPDAGFTHTSLAVSPDGTIHIAYSDPVNYDLKYATSEQSQISYHSLVKSVSPTSGGAISVSPEKSDYDDGESVILTANPESCYNFTSWSGDCSGTNPTCTLTMDADKSAIANFAIKTFTVTITKTGNGTGTLSESTQTVNCGDNLTITATPDATSDFAGWTGDASGTGNAVLTGIISDKTLTATFTLRDLPTLVTDTTGWVTVPEGNTATFGVKLSAPPGRSVTVTTGRFSGDTDISVWSGATLSFTDSDWDTYKTVTLAAAEDADITDGEAAIQITASGLDSKLITAAEDDTDLLTLVTDTASVTVPEGETAAFGVRLSAPPGRAVTVTVTRFSGDTDISVRSGAELSFTDSAWDTYKSVTLTAAADADTEEGKAVIQISASGLDSASVTATEQEPPVNIAAPGLIPREDTADTTPTLEWNPVPGATNYRIQISSQSSFATTLAETETATLSHTPSEALPPGGIYWRVSSDLDYAYFSAYDHFFVTAATLNPPANPQAVSGASSVRLTWEPVTGTDIAGYNVYRFSLPDGSYTRISTDPVTGDTYTDDAVPAGDAAYHYYLTAVDADGSESTPSDVVSAVPGQVRLFIPDARGEAGTQIRLPVNIANADGLRMCSADIYVTYNPNVLSAADIERTPLSSAYSWGTALEMPGIVRAILVGSDEARERLYGEGSLFYLIFDVRGNSGDTTPLEFQSAGTFFYDCDDSYETKEVALDLSDIGIFRVDGSHILGDSNGDGKVNSADVFTTLNIAVGNLELTEKRLNAGDVSGDGRIRSNDAAMTVRLALGRSLVPESSSQKPGSSGLSVPDNTVIPAAGSVWVPIDTDDASAVMGADIILSYDPLVVTAAGVRLGPVTENFGIQVNREQPGQIRISFSALAGDGLSGGTGALIEAEFTARTDISEKRTSPLTLTTVRLNDTYGRDFATSALQAEVRTSSGSLTVGDGYSLHDVIAALRVLAGTDEGGVSSDADISGDGKMGMEEVIRILQIVAD